MSEDRRSARLDALGIDVYVTRGRPVADATELAIPTLAAVPEPALVGAAADPVAAVAGLDWDALQQRVAICSDCALHETRTQAVFGVGNRRARWLFIGEAPGAEEDRRGEPFVGRAGQLLNEMLRAIGFAREDVYIANVLKCRPPNNRDPRPDEVASCRGHLERQIELVAPKMIVAVGRIAAQSLLGTDTALGRMRGKLHRLGSRGWPVVVTYHPAYLLRSPSQKRRAWEDLLFAMREYRRIESQPGSG